MLIESAVGFTDAGSDGRRSPMRLLRPHEVCERAALSSTHVYRLIVDGRFPPFATIADRASALPEVVLDAFFVARMAAREGLPALGFRGPLPLWRFDPAAVPALRAIRLLRCGEVLNRTGLSKTTLRRLIAAGRFPAPVPLGSRATRWVEHEVERWVRSLDPSDVGAVAPPCEALDHSVATV